jgi:thymidylate synthase (FAD)
MNVTLLSWSPDPVKSLYLAYRTCYSRKPPEEIPAENREKMLEFVQERLKTGHTSPLEQVWFEFAISGVSRAFSHQFVRHRVGMSVEQQSQRYVVYRGGVFDYVMPGSIKSNPRLQAAVESHFAQTAALYDELVRAGVPAEDARFVLPNAAATNLKVTINLQALLHMADLRLCTRAQWEFRKVVALMRAEIMKKVDPLFARMLQPKCGAGRLGYCDEEYEAWEACPIGKVRPHKTQVLGGSGGLIPEEDLS